MINPVSVPLGIDRAKPRVFRIAVRGADLSGAEMHAQIRLTPDTPGEPLLDLPTVSGSETTGIRLVAVDKTGAVPVSTIDVQIAGTVEWPAAPELGGAWTGAWDLFVALSGGSLMEKWISGPVVISPTVTKGAPPGLVALPDAAPSNAVVTLAVAALTLTLGADLQPVYDRIAALATATGDHAGATDDAVTALQARAGDVEDRATSLEQHAGTVDTHLAALDDQAYTTDALIASFGATASAWPRGAHRAWRLKITSGNFDFNARAAELAFRAAPGGAALAITTAFGSPTAEIGVGPQYAFDGNTDTQWFGDAPFPVYLGAIFPQPVSVNEFALTASTAVAAPKDMTLQWSNDSTTGFDGAWTDAWTPSDQTGWANGETRTFTDPLYGQVGKRVILGSPASGDLFTARPGGGYDKLPAAVGAGGGSSRSANTQALIAAVRSQGCFPVLPTAAADTPTVTIGSAATLTTPLVPATIGGADNPVFLQRYGPTVIGNGYSHVRGPNRAKPGAVPSYSGGFSATEVLHTGKSIELMTVAGGGAVLFRLIVDGRVAWTYTPTTPGGQAAYFRFTFPTSRARVLSFETGNTFFGGARAGAGESLAATPNSYPVISMLGDSFGEGTGSTRANGGLLAVAAQALGCAANIMAVGGTGILQPGACSPYTDPTRIADWLMTGTGVAPALGILPGTQNDSDTALAGSYPSLQAAITAGTSTLIDAWLAAHPTAPVIVVGPWVSSSQDVAPPSIATYYVRDGMLQAADQYRRHEVYFIDQLVEQLIAGRSDVSGSQAGYYAIPEDHLHPSQAGHDMRGSWHARKVEELVMASFA